MKRKLLSLTAALACCVLLAAAIIYMKHSDGKDSEPDLPQQEQEQSSPQSFHSSDMIASREDIKTVTVTSGSESFTVVAGQNGADPHIRELEGIRQNVQLENALLALCKSISPEKLVEENAGDLKKYGLDKPSGSAEINYSDGTKVRVLAGDASPSNERQVYAAIEGQKKVWLVESSVSIYFTGKAKDYVSQVMSPQSERTSSDSAKMTVTSAASQYDITLERKGEKWSMTAPLKAQLDEQKSSAVTGGLYGLNAEYCEKVRPDSDDKARCGLDKPAAEVTLKEGSTELKLKIGSAAVRKDESEKERYYCIIEGVVGTDCIYAVAKEYLPWLSITVQGLVSDVILPNYLVNLRGVSITIGGKNSEFVITNEGGDPNRINEDVSKMRTVRVTSEGRELELDKFRELYEYLMKCSSDKIYTEKADNGEYAVIVYKKNDGSQDRLGFVPVSGGYAVKVNGQVSYLVGEDWLSGLTVKINALGQQSSTK
jgi:hypothetical protein